MHAHRFGPMRAAATLERQFNRGELAFCAVCGEEGRNVIPTQVTLQPPANNTGGRGQDPADKGETGPGEGGFATLVTLIQGKAPAPRGQIAIGQTGPAGAEAVKPLEVTTIAPSPEKLGPRQGALLANLSTTQAGRSTAASSALAIPAQIAASGQGPAAQSSNAGQGSNSGHATDQQLAALRAAGPAVTSANGEEGQPAAARGPEASPTPLSGLRPPLGANAGAEAAPSQALAALGVQGQVAPHAATAPLFRGERTGQSGPQTADGLVPKGRPAALKEFKLQGRSAAPNAAPAEGRFPFGETLHGPAPQPRGGDSLSAALPPVMGSATAAGSATGAAGTPAPASPPQQLAHALAEAAQAGRKQVEVRLDPPELGKVRMFLMADERGLTARVVVERAESLHMLQSEVRQLERALENAGYKLNTAEFSLSQNGGHSARNKNAPGQGTQGHRTADGDPSTAGQDHPPTGEGAQIASGLGAVDRRI